jgi:hypothetical protein
MAGDILAGYGSSNQTITITLTSLVSAAGRVCTAIDNSSNKFTDAGVFLKTKTGTTAGNKQLLVYAIGSVNGGTTYTDNVSATDAAVSTQPPTAPLVKGIGVLVSTTAYYVGPFSVAGAFGFLPERWSLVVWNDGGGTLSATSGDHGMWYQGIKGTYT